MTVLMPYFLTRQPNTPDSTFGRWTDSQGKQLCVTVELPWNNNHPETSCIPTGTFLFESYNSPKHGQVWMAQGVPDRSNIEVHNANWAKQLLGCIGVGKNIELIEGIMGVSNSMETLDYLRITLPKSFTLTIR